MDIAKILPTIGLVALVAGSATAQEKPKFELFAGAGLASPLAPQLFSDAWKNGWDVGGGAAYRFNSRLAVEGRVEYDEYVFDRAGLEGLILGETGFDPFDFGLDFDIEGAEVSMLSFVGDLKFSILGDDKRISPYVMGGGGIGRLATAETTLRATVLPIYDLLFDPELFSLEETIEAQSETAPLVTFGGGVDIRASHRITIFVEGRYQRLFTEEEPTDHGAFRAGARIGF